MDNDSSLSMLKERLNSNPQDAEAAVQLGNLYFDKLNPPTAVMYYQIALAINPNQPSVWTDMGTMLWRNQDTGLAEVAFKSAINLDAGFGNAYVNLGLLYHHAMQDLQQARVIWQELVEKNPQHPAADNARQLLVDTAGEAAAS